MTSKLRAAGVCGLLTVLVLAGCSAPTTPSDTSTTELGDTEYPLTVQNCGEEVTFDRAPERVMLLESAAVTLLDGLGVLDDVIARAGTFPAEYYDAELGARVAEIEVLSDDIDASGHLSISAEVVLGQQPDLVLGLPEGLTRETLYDGGANTLIQPVYCPGDVGDATFEMLYEQIIEYGAIFDRAPEADALVEKLRERVAAVEASTAGAPSRTAAVLYPSVGGGPVYAYGRSSMSQPQLAAAGFANVFADTGERVFEVSVEELIDRDPDVLILLYQGDQTGVLESVETLPGADALRALKNDNVLIQLFNFTEPATPLSVDGLEHIAERFGS